MKEFVPEIILLILSIYSMFNSKTIYLRLTNDNQYTFLKKFKILLFLNLIFILLIVLLRPIANSNEYNNTFIVNIGFFSVLIDSCLMLYTILFFTNKKYFKNQNKRIIDSIRLSIKFVVISSIFVVFVSIIVAIVRVYFLK